MKPSTRSKHKSAPKDSAWLQELLHSERAGIGIPATLDEARGIGRTFASLDLDPGERLPTEMIPLLP